MLSFLLYALFATQELFLWPSDYESLCDILAKLQRSHSSKFNHNCNDPLLFRAKKQHTPHKFIVTLSSKVTAPDIVKNLTSIKDELQSKGSSKITIQEEYSYCMNGFAALLSPVTLIELLGNEDVVSIEQDNYAYLLSLQRNPIWNLDRIDQSNNRLDDLYNTGGLDGRGVDIYILDTGINPHQEFGSRLGEGKNFVGSSGDWGDCNGHGTHCAGSAGGERFGVAKGSTLHAVRVLGCDGSGSWSQILQGIDWMIDRARNTPNRAIGSMSLGGPKSNSINTAVNNAVRQGVVMVVAAGNENTDACTTSPASAVNAISVGATTVNDRRSSFSNYGSCVSIFAPGSNIRSASYRSRTGSSVLSGTSMACPQVAGAVALFMQESRFTLSPRAALQRMLSAATRNTISDSRSTAPFLRVPIDGQSPEPGPSICRTIGGPQTGRRCIFPFTFRGQTFNRCTTDFDPDGRRWCSVEVDLNGNHINGQWGYCAPTCPSSPVDPIRPILPTRSPTRQPLPSPTTFPTRFPSFIPILRPSPSPGSPDICRTVGGPVSGQPCVFPFTIGDRVYLSCTKDLDPAGRSWCSVETDQDGKHIRGRWGYCPQECVKPSPTSRPTDSPTNKFPILPPAPQPNPERPASPCDILDAINDLRAKAKLPGLRFDARLQDAAAKHAVDMAKRGYFDHLSPEGENVDERVIREGYEWKAVAENIAAGYNDCNGLIEGWKSSEGHYKNILCTNCVDTGIGAYFSEGSEWRYYYVQVFGATDQDTDPPLFTCPPPPTPAPPPKCITSGGPSTGKQCLFPFIYNGITYNRCIEIGNQKSWCSTAVTPDRRHIPRIGGWGYCRPNCLTTKSTCSTKQWWCTEDTSVIIGESYGPINITIPDLTITGIPDVMIEDDIPIEKEDTNTSKFNANYLFVLLLLIIPLAITVHFIWFRSTRSSISRSPTTPVVSTEINAQL